MRRRWRWWKEEVEVEEGQPPDFKVFIRI